MQAPDIRPRASSWPASEPSDIPLDPKAEDERSPGRTLAGCLQPCCQSTSLPPAPRAGQRRSPLDRNAGDERAQPGPGGLPFIRAANLNPYRRHHRQSASLPPPHEQASGQAGGATGDPR